MQYTSTYQSPMGESLLACDEAGLTGYAGGLQRKIGPLTFHKSHRAPRRGRRKGMLRPC